MDRAEGVVSLGATELFTELRRLEEWPEWVEGLHDVQTIGHRRYRWDVDYAGQRRQVDVVVSFDHRRRTITWKALRHPAFDGGLRLVPLDAQRTRVYCWLAVEPIGMVETFLTGRGLDDVVAARSLQRLAEWVARRPPPVGEDAEGQEADWQRAR